MNNSRIFYTFLSGFTLSIFICSFLKINFDFGVFFIVLSTILFLFGKFKAEMENTVILLSIFILAVGVGILRYDLKDARNENNDKVVSQFVGQKVVLKGVVSDEPNVTEQSARLTIEAQEIRVENKKGQPKNSETEISGKILVNAGLFPKFKYGDEIEAVGKLKIPENFTATSSNPFDYVGFLAKEDIYYELSFANAWLISSGHGSRLKIKLFEFKNAFTDRINFLIKEPESSLLGGLLLGAKNSLGKEWQNNFRQAGVSHIVALSGYNITIVAEGIMSALYFLPRFIGLWCGAFGIFLFAIMTGGSATVLRASIMALLVLLAKATGRTYDVIRALLLAGFFMLLQNPKILVFDMSFQLSFLATIALIFVSPLVEKRFLFITEKYKFRELIVSSIATQIFVLPFIFYKMGMISLVSLPANVIILPIIPMIMLLGFITGVVAFISTTLAIPFALTASLLLSYQLKVIEFFAHLPFATLNINNFPLSLVVVIYLIFLRIIWRHQIVSRPLTSLD